MTSNNLKIVSATVVASTSLSSITLATPASASSAGSSYSTAIIVPASDEMVGVKWEYAYIRTHYPGSKFMYQALDSQGRKPYDIMTFKTADGKQHRLYSILVVTLADTDAMHDLANR